LGNENNLSAVTIMTQISQQSFLDGIALGCDHLKNDNLMAYFTGTDAGQDGLLLFANSVKYAILHLEIFAF
jgi:hypothetical protein